MICNGCGRRRQILSPCRWEHHIRKTLLCVVLEGMDKLCIWTIWRLVGCTRDDSHTSPQPNRMNATWRNRSFKKLSSEHCVQKDSRTLEAMIQKRSFFFNLAMTWQSSSGIPLIPRYSTLKKTVMSKCLQLSFFTPAFSLWSAPLQQWCAFFLSPILKMYHLNTPIVHWLAPRILSLAQ